VVARTEADAVRLPRQAHAVAGQAHPDGRGRDHDASAAVGALRDVLDRADLLVEEAVDDRLARNWLEHLDALRAGG
jgi:hypothetical protein